ncbi:unnamed protein product, partial [Pylaiella littoralis]
ELYNFFVEERKNAIAIKLEYPSQKYLIAKPRARVLYYIAGWLASRVWTHQRRHNLSPDWVRVVRHNTYQSSQEAIAHEPVLRDFVEVVDRKNDLKNGPGLLCSTMDWFELTYALEGAYFHFLKDPIYLGTYLGGLPAEI